LTEGVRNDRPFGWKWVKKDIAYNICPGSNLVAEVLYLTIECVGYSVSTFEK
jgi:hypothetical protein